MNQLALIIADHALAAAAGARASCRFFGFFTANTRIPHTRRAYDRSFVEFLNDRAEKK